jgi:EF-P beta-lysylation protein EpmB
MKNQSEPWPAGEWRKQLADGVTSVEELLEQLDLDAAALDTGPSTPAQDEFPFRVPRGYVSRMRRGDPHDPLLRQVLPLAIEDEVCGDFSVDPLGELKSPPSRGLLQKYRGRALLMVTGACAINCRYCFRRHFPYGDHTGVSNLATAAARIAADPSLHEIILSGGDPLVRDDDLLGEIANLITDVPHVQRLRIHTRVPIVFPQRVDENLVKWLTEVRVPTVVVVHANHPAEIDREVERALGALGSTGVTLLNQAVLLRGVNDSVETQCELSERLFAVGVLPYYLHMLDRVQGAAHFEVPDDEARALMAEVRAALPGYLVPRLVREVEGEPSKVHLELGTRGPGTGNRDEDPFNIEP